MNTGTLGIGKEGTHLDDGHRSVGVADRLDDSGRELRAGIARGARQKLLHSLVLVRLLCLRLRRLAGRLRRRRLLSVAFVVAVSLLVRLGLRLGELVRPRRLLARLLGERRQQVFPAVVLVAVDDYLAKRVRPRDLRERQKVSFETGGLHRA